MLESFAKLGSEDIAVRRGAGVNIFHHVLTNSSELEYAVTRLIRGLESQKVSTRSGSYSTLATLLGLNKLKADELREIMTKTLQTDQQTTNKERRLVYIARILASGVILRIVPLSQLILDEALFKGILNDLVDLGKKRSTLLELATPFICHLLSQKEMDTEIFKELVWPCLLPLFVKGEIVKKENEVKEDEENEEIVEKGAGKNSSSILQIALTCSEKGLKSDFQFLGDINIIVKMLLAHKAVHVSELVSLIVSYVKREELVEEFWNSIASQMRSSHFQTICICVQKSVEAEIPHNLLVKEEIVAALLSVFRNEDAPEQHSEASKTLASLLKWSNHEDKKMGKKNRKHVMKILFGGSPSLLHEYQTLVRIIRPFIVDVCTERDFSVLESIVEKSLGSEDGLSVRMAIVYITFLTKMTLCKKISAELKSKIGKRLLSIAFGKEQLHFVNITNVNNTNENEENEESVKQNGVERDEESDQLVSKSCNESLTSMLSTTYCPPFLDELIQHIMEDLDIFCKEKHIKKLFKKAEKQRQRTSDNHLKYIIGSYAVKLVLEQDHVLGEAQSLMEELLELAKSSSDDASAEIAQFILSSVAKDEQPPFDFEGLFSRMLIEEKVSEAVIQQFAESVDVEIDEGADGEDDSSDSDGSDEDDENDDNEEMGEEEAEDENEQVKPKKLKQDKNTVKKEVDSEESDEEDDAIDMDDATAEDLKSMDKALGKVFANKKKLKEEETSETRSKMRTFRLLENLLTRSEKKCNISIPLMLLLPVIHALQASISGKKNKYNTNLTSRIVAVLNKLNSIKKFEGGEAVESGVLLTMAKDLVQMSKLGKNKGIGDMLGDSALLLTKCYLQGTRKTKGEDVGFITLYTGLLDLKDDRRNKSTSVATSMITSALTALPDWEQGKNAISKRLVSIIFDPLVRRFRRMQFLVLLRAALADKSQPRSTGWKTAALQELIRHAADYLSKAANVNNDMKMITRELIHTLVDVKGDPKLVDIVAEFFTDFYTTQPPAVLKEITKKFPQIKIFLIAGGLSGDKFQEIIHGEVKGKAGKRKKATQESSQSVEATPSKKKKGKKNQ